MECRPQGEWILVVEYWKSVGLSLWEGGVEYRKIPIDNQRMKSSSVAKDPETSLLGSNYIRQETVWHGPGWRHRSPKVPIEGTVLLTPLLWVTIWPGVRGSPLRSWQDLQPPGHLPDCAVDSGLGLPTHQVQETVPNQAQHISESSLKRLGGGVTQLSRPRLQAWLSLFLQSATRVRKKEETQSQSTTDWLRKRLGAGRALRTVAIGQARSSHVLSWEVQWEWRGIARWQKQCERRINIRRPRRMNVRREKLEGGVQDYVKISYSRGWERGNIIMGNGQEEKMWVVGRREVAMFTRRLEMQNLRVYSELERQRTNLKVSIYKPKEKPCCNRRFYKLYSRETNSLLSQKSLLRSYKV